MLTNSIGMEFVLIPAGMFMMGSPDSDADAYDAEKPAHRVIISQPFYLGKYPVTNRQYAAFLKQEWRQEAPDKSLGGYHASRPGTRAIIRWWASAGTRAGPTVTGCLGRRGSVIACPPRLSGKKRPAAQQVGAIPGGCVGGRRRHHSAKGTVPVSAYPEGASVYGCCHMLGNAGMDQHPLGQ